MRRFATVTLAGISSLGLSSAVTAQAPRSAPAAATKSLPSDSLQLGRRYAFWMMGGSADSILAHTDAAMRDRLGGKAGVETQQAQIAEHAGAEKAVLEERWTWRNGMRQYWRTMAMTGLDEPFLLRIVIVPSGEISGIGLGLASMAPKADSAGPPIKAQ